MKRIAVFCASSMGNEKSFKEHASLLGKALAEKNIELVYGGSNVGLMGVVADSLIEHNGKAIGVLPHFLKDKEIAHKSLTELILVETMHERKLLMSELSDGVIALPGAFGTLEELFETLTWNQLGLHSKPVGLLNVNGYYNQLLDFLRTVVEKGFMKEVYLERLLVSNDANNLLEQMNHYKVPATSKWDLKHH